MGLFGGGEKTTPIEKAVHNATDESLTRENWGLIIEVCNLVNDNPEIGARESVAAIRKRLDVKNGNVQLYALTLLNALAQNCGSMIHREVASSSTLQQLERIGLSHSTYRAVRTRLIEILGQLADQFESDPSLRQVRVTYDRIVKAFPQGSGEASAQRPHPRQQREQPKAEEEDDEDLKLALELSLKEANPAQPAVTEIDRVVNRPENVEEPNQDAGPKYVRALYDFTASEAGELSFRAGDVLEVLDSVYRDWWRGELRGTQGIFPVNYVEVIENAKSPAQESSNPDMDEATIFAQVPTVEKLLSIFATAAQHPGYGILENHDVQKLYHDVIAMRPNLIQLIDEYSKRKQVLLDLNEKLASARRAYERLIQGALGPANHSPSLASGSNGYDTRYSRSNSGFNEMGPRDRASIRKPIASPNFNQFETNSSQSISSYQNGGYETEDPHRYSPVTERRTFSQNSLPEYALPEGGKASQFGPSAEPPSASYHQIQRPKTFARFGGSPPQHTHQQVLTEPSYQSGSPDWRHDSAIQAAGQPFSPSAYNGRSRVSQYEAQVPDDYNEQLASASHYPLNGGSNQSPYYLVPPAGTAIPNPNPPSTAHLPYPDKPFNVSAPPAPSAPDY